MADQTKDRIVEAAYRTLVAHGYHDTSMKDIAREAGVAPGLAHYYFETKEDLLVAAIERGCRPAMEAWDAAGAIDALSEMAIAFATGATGTTGAPGRPAEER